MNIVRKCKDCGKELDFYEWNSILTYRKPMDTANDLIGWSGADVYCDECYNIKRLI